MKSNWKKRMLAVVLCMVIALSNSSFIFASTGTEEPAAVAQEGDPQNVQEVQTEAAVQDTPAVLSETTPEATPEATPEPTQVPEVTAAPTEAPQATAEPTQAPEVTAAPETTPVPTEAPAVTAEPTQAPEITPTPTPEVTAAPEATPVPTEAPVTYNEAVELKHEFKDENGNVTATVTAQIPAGAFQADASELTMEVKVPDQAATEKITKLMEERLPENYILGDTVFYDIRFKVNGTETESQQPIVITFENQNGITVKDVKKAVVFQLDPADPAVEGDKDELVTITQRNDMIESLQNSGQSTDNVDDYDLSEITLKEDGTSNKIRMEGRTSTIYGCYVETLSEEKTMSQKVGDITVSVKAPEGAFSVNSDLVTMTADPLTEEQKELVEEQLQKQADAEGMEVGAYVAYDINLWANGEKIQPQVPVTVTFENTGLESYDADDTTGFQVDETSEQFTTIEKIGQTEEKVEVTAEHFTITGAWATEQSAPVTLERDTEDFESIAEKYWPSSETTNQWQIVEELYNRADGHADSEYTLTSDGMFRLQKKAIPTGTENEFYIYLNMEPVMSWEDVFKQSTMWLCNSASDDSLDVSELPKDYNAADALEWLKAQGMSGGSHIYKIVDASEDAKKYPDNTSFHNASNDFPVKHIRLYTDQGESQDIEVDMHFTMNKNAGSANESFTIIFSAPNSTSFVKLSEVRYEKSTKTLIIPEDAWGNIVSGEEDGDLNLLNGNVAPTQVVDQMGKYITDVEIVKTTNGKAVYNSDQKCIVWNEFEDLPETAEEKYYVIYEGDYYRKNAYQLVYKIRLDVTAEGFESCAEELFAEEMDDEDVHYQTNAKTELNYLVATDDGKKEEDAKFISPEVRGLLYDIEFQKVDGAESPLLGAEFKLTGENEISVKATSGEDGFVKFSNLPCGTYQLEEEEAPSGYINSYESESFELCYTTNRGVLKQDHSDKHDCDGANDSQNALYDKIGEDGKIVNESEGIDPGPDPSNPSKIPYSKQIDWLGDDDENPDTNLSGDYFYRLYLDATGIPDTEPDAADIIFILDMSNSMNFNMDHTGGDLWDDDKTNDDVEEGTRRLDYVKSSAITAIESIQNTAERQSADINIGIVTFNYGNGKHYHDHHNPHSDDYIGYGEYDKEKEKYYGSHNGTKILSGLTDDYTELISQINGLDTEDLDGRTNYQAAFEKADELLENSTSEKKYVVFITDGETNGYTSDQDVEEFVEITDNQKAINEANSVAKAWENVLDGFYTIAVSTDILKDKLSGVGPSKVARLNLQANDEDSIEDAFNTVVSAITKQVCDVTITDQLSEYVEFVNESGQTFSEQNISDPTAENIALKVTKTSENGKVEELDPDSYTVEIDAKTKQISVNFGEDYFLEPKATYTISFNVKLTDKAFEDPMQAIGDEDTDYGSNNTSSGKTGHKSNQEAAVTYSTVTNGELKEYKEIYKDPVVQVQNRTEWELFKKSDTQTSNLYLAGAVFELWKDDNQLKYIGTSIEDNQETTSVNEQGYVQWKNLDGTVIQEKDMEVGTYILKEVQAPVGYSLSSTTWRVTIKYMEAPEIVPVSSDGTEGTALDCIVEGDHEKHVFVITNTALYDLPSAGGSGIFWYLISGTAFMMAASLILYRMKRKEVLGK